MLDDRNDYTHAGKGAKRRERLRLEDIPKRIARPSTSTRPEIRNVRKPERKEEQDSGRNVKERIRRLLLDHDMSYADICETLKRDGHSVTGVAVSHIRSEMQEILRMLMRPEIGLIEPEALARYRHKRSR